MGKIIKWCTNNAKLVIILIVGLTIMFAVFAIKIKVNSSVDNLLPDNSQIVSFAKNNNLSPQDGYFIIGVERPKNGFTVSLMQEFDTAIHKIEKLDAINSVISPFDSVDFTSKGKRLITVPLLKGKAPENQEELNKFIDGFINNPVYKGQLVSEDGTIISAIFSSKPLSNDAHKFVKEVNKILEPMRKETKVYTMGENPVYARVNYYLVRDMIILFSCAVVGMVISFYFGFGFRTKRSVLIPLSVVLIGIVWTLGFMSLVGWQLTIISICIPILVLSIGSSYAIHFLSQIFKDYAIYVEEKKTKQEWIIYSGSRINKTIVLAALTTIIGFLMLLFTSVSQTREFGYATSFGIFTCMLLSLTYIPAVLMLTRVPNIPKEKTRKLMRGSLSDASSAIGKFIVKTKYMFVLIFIAVAAIYFIIQPFVAIQSDYFSYFPKKDEVIKDMTYFIGKTGGYQMLNVTISSDEDKYFLQPNHLKKIREIENEILKEKNITNITSFTSYISNIHKRAYKKEEKFDSKGEIMLMYRLLSNAQNLEGADATLKNMIDNNGKRITLSIKVYNSNVNKPITEAELQKTYSFLESKFNILKEQENLTYNIWSNDLRFLNLTDQLNKDQFISMSLSIIALFMIMTFAFNKVKYATIALVPLFSCIIMNFIALVAFRIPQDITTMLVGSISIGVAVDNAIHYMLNYKRSREDGLSYQDAIIETHRYTGRPIIHTTLSVVGGLVFLSFSSYKAIAYFGILICLTLLFAMIASLTTMPSFIILDELIKEKIRKRRSKK